jgi:hypothetical protein
MSFVKASRLPPVDYYIPSQRLVIEFDEPQHFTSPRMIALRSYPTDLGIGFDRTTWIDLCAKLDRHDADPVYRDEQRAWYDTLRDFSVELLGHRPLVRIPAMRTKWCSPDTTEGDVMSMIRHDTV